MSQGTESNPAAESFAAHVRAFHQSLPNEEKQLLEQVFALAEVANSLAQSENNEVRGYAIDAFMYFNTYTGGALPVADKDRPRILGTTYSTLFGGAKKV